MEATPNLLAISDKEQAEHSLQDKQKAVQEELTYLSQTFKSAGQLESSAFMTESVSILLIATESLLKNKLNFDVEKRRQQQSGLALTDHDFFQKRLFQCLKDVKTQWLKPTLLTHCQSYQQEVQLDKATRLLEEGLEALKSSFPEWVHEKLVSL